ncbi:hypothetical protein [Burkholderia gladioli]|uniref:hypothetical protein n=1 Tax=Burkholderia gladioli TaxID=28095 RepID=UPI00163FEFEE|nr:hypothetical protein [Burkholderia gladioli]MDN7602439.1 hypothetical protein [Burkholderia gladioli]
MKHLNFALHHINSLRKEFSSGFTRLSLAFAVHGKPISVTLWRSDGTGLQVQCRMHDVFDRVEYGVLEFERALGNGDGETFIDLPDDLRLAPGSTVAKLILTDDGVMCESGFAVIGSQGSELIVVAGAYPYTLAVSVAGLPEPFEPEFPLDKYDRVEIA